MKKDIWQVVVFVFGLASVFFIMFITAPKKGQVVVVDCTWSEISPDFSPEAREMCRKARAEQIKK